jgi:hypothetical protein
MCRKDINNITKEERIILELINQIEDPETKIKYLSKIVQKEKIIANDINYNLNDVSKRFKQEKHPTTGPDLKFEINNIKQEIKELKYNFKISNEQLVQEFITLQSEEQHTKKIIQNDKIKNHENTKHNSIDKELFINLIDRIIFQKWYVEVTLIINAEFQITTIALLDSGADMNCIQEGIISTKYYEKTTEKLHQASGTRLNIEYKIPNAHICNDEICFKTTIILVKDITSRIILRNLFLALFDSFIKTEKRISTEIMRKKILSRFISKQIMFLKQKHKRIKEQLNDPLLQQRIKSFQRKIESEICANISKAFGYNKNHVVQLPYESNFDKKIILTKIRPIQISQELLDYCNKEIQDLLQKYLKQKGKLPWNYSAFYVQKNVELKTLKWIRYPIPNKRNLLSRLYDATIFSKFNMKSRFWQIRINRYKITFTISFRHYERNDMSKNALREFQNIMNNIFNPFTSFFINDVLIFSKSIKQNWKYLHAFVQIINNNGLVIPPTKINLSLNNIHFLGHIIVQKIIINKSLQFLDEIKDKNQLQRFIRSLNYISDYYKHSRIICKNHYQKLKKNSPHCSNQHTKIIRHVKIITCLNFRSSNTFRIIETNVSEIGKEYYEVCYHSGIWYTPQNYSIMKKEILAIVLCIHKFQNDFLNQEFIICVEYEEFPAEIPQNLKRLTPAEKGKAKENEYEEFPAEILQKIPQKDDNNIASKQIFTKWQVILSSLNYFDFKIKYIKRESNSIPDFLTHDLFSGKMNKPDRSKIQNPGDYAIKQSSQNNPSFTSPTNVVPTHNKFTVLGSFPPYKG